jgi:hypothetical protein
VVCAYNARMFYTFVCFATVIVIVVVPLFLVLRQVR